MGKEENKEEAENGTGAKPQGKKSPMKLILLIIVVVALGGGGFYVWNSGLLKGFSKEKKKAVAAAAVPAKAEIGPIRSMEAFIVNLADPMGKRYLKVRMDIELDEDKVMPEVEKRLPQLRDTIVSVLSSKTYDDIGGLDGKMQLRAELMTMLNQFLRTGKITNIYFTEFIVQ